MNDKDIDARLKAADPVKKIELSDSLLEVARFAKPRRFFSPKQIRFSFTGFAAAAALAIALPTLIPTGSSGYLISLGDNQSAEGGLNGGAVDSESSKAADKMMAMMPWVQYEYSAGAKLGSESGASNVYQLVLKGDPKQTLANLAPIFGVAGEVVKQSPEYGEDTYIVGSRDGSGESISLWWGGTGSWWYSNPAAWPQPKCLHYTDSDTGKEGAPDSWCDQYEEVQPTPDLIPSEELLTAQALKIFQATGLDLSAKDIKLNRDEWGAWANASLKVAGQDTAIEWMLQWGQNGKLGYASGQAVQVIDRGSFATVSQKTAVARMSDWRYSGSIASSLWEKYAPQGGMVMRGGSAVKAYGEESPSGGEAVDPSIEPSTEPVPEPSVEPSIEPMPEPSVVQAVVNRAHSVLVLIYDKSGAAWLVPGYLFIADVDYAWPVSVFCLEDGIVELPEAGEVGIMY